MSDDPISVLRTHAPRPDQAIPREEASLWADGVLDVLLASGFLIEASPAEHLRCPACDVGHLARVLVDDGPPRRPLIACPEAGLVALRDDLVRRFAVVHHAIVRWLGTQIGATGEPDEPIAAQAWRWDRVRVGGQRRSLIIVRHLGPRDGDDERRHLGVSSSSVVLSLGVVPSLSTAMERPALVAPAWRYIDVDEGAFTFALDALVEDLGDADDARARRVTHRAGTRRSRADAIDALRRFLAEHLASAKQTLRDGLPLPPRPQQKLLAAYAKVDEATVSRCLRDPSAGGCRLRRLWQIADDAEAVRAFDPRAA